MRIIPRRSLVLNIPGTETRNGLCEDLELGRGIGGGQMSLAAILHLFVLTDSSIQGQPRNGKYNTCTNSELIVCSPVSSFAAHTASRPL